MPDNGIHPLGMNNNVELQDLSFALEREWLVTNGIGGFASGTLAHINTRRHHSLMIASYKPPLDRYLLWSNMLFTIRCKGETLQIGGGEQGADCFIPENVGLAKTFHLEGQTPVWTYSIGGETLELRIGMTYGKNETFLVFKASSDMEIVAEPWCVYRDYHHEYTQGSDLPFVTTRDSITLQSAEGSPLYEIHGEGFLFTVDERWETGLYHRVEAYRGLGANEDVLVPGHFEGVLKANTQAGFVTSTELISGSAATLLEQEQVRQQSLLKMAGVKDAESLEARLVWAADQFVVERRDEQQNKGATVIAGYPWFTDWGRDTMIALPGLTLSAGRYEEAAMILRTFGRHVSKGMIPNRFPDYGDIPEYNTVDATLWFFNAMHQYLEKTSDLALVEELFDTLCDIVDWHERGTRYNIGVDATDGLVYAGEEGVQLTWMDAKAGDWVVTPRIGKPVEINALWYNALCVMEVFSGKLGHREKASLFGDKAEQVRKEFNARFWNEDLGCLYDVIDGPEGEPGLDGKNKDPKIRPNQLFAISLDFPVLDTQRAASVVEVCRHHLWTPHGLRSLAPEDVDYNPGYGGDQVERDASYHQGVVWGWLIGPFVFAHYHAHQDPDQAKSFIKGLIEHLFANGCMGSASEIFEGTDPFYPRGCFAQAWSVSEMLRIVRDIG